VRSSMAKPAAKSPADNLQPQERLWEYLWRWQSSQPLAVQAATKATPATTKGTKRCLVEGCKGASHQLVECKKFLSVGPINRYVHCLKNQWCIVCLGEAHEWSSWTRAGQPPFLEAITEVGGCSKCGSWHHKMVACPDQVSPAAVRVETAQLAASVCVVGTSQPRPVQMQAQKVETCGGEDLIAFWDLGSQVTMLTHRKAATAGLMPEPAPLCSSRVSRVRDCC
jgi:hypothetical protein